MSRRIPLTMVAFLLVSALLFFPRSASVQAAPSSALPAMLLTLDGIKGGFQGAPYKGAIEVSSYSLGAFNDVGIGPGPVSGKTTFTDVTLNKQIDESSIPLLKALTTGKRIKDGYLYFQTGSASKQRTYMIIHFTNLVVTGYQYNFSDGSLPIETVSLQAESFLFKYMTVNPDGSPGGIITVPIGMDQGVSSVTTKYHFEAINAKTDKGNTYIAGFTVSLEATAVNSTVQQTKYRINGGDWTVYTEPFKIYAGNTHTVEYYSTDVDGDIEKINVMNFDTGTFTGSGSY